LGHRDVPVDVDVEMKKAWCSYSGLSLSRTRKGPKNLFEIEEVRDGENYRKNQNFY